jgi:N-acetylneuraminic acid mutarotase
MIKNLKIGLFFFFLSLSLCGYSSWKWTKVHALDNGKRYEATSFTANGKGYVSCGVDTNDNCYNDLWEYDAAFDYWTQKVNLPADYRRGAYGFELNNYGYLGGGTNDATSSLGTILNDFWMYDPILNTWTAKSACPTLVYRAASTSCNGKGYVMCGVSGSWGSSSDVYAYDPTFDSWTYETTFPGLATSSGGRDGGIATSANNKIYFGMGKDDSFFQNDWWEYNPTTNVWLQKSNFPGSGRTGAFAFTVNGMPCAGMGSDGSYNNDTWWYNITTDTWNYTTSFSGTARRGVVCFVIGNVGYMGTGKSGGGSKQDFYKLDADVDVEDLEKNSYITLYPNPVIGNEFMVQYTQPFNTFMLQVLSLDGKIIKTQELTKASQTIDRTGLSKGIYFVTILNKGQVVATKKIILL